MSFATLSALGMFYVCSHHTRESIGLVGIALRGSIREQELPASVEAYSRSPEFNQDTLPAALRKQHSTKVGTWALIHVLEGKLNYRIYELPSETVLEPGKPGVVQPEQLHEVTSACTPMRLYVEFYAARKS